MGADIRQDPLTEAVSTPLAVLPRFRRPGPSKEVEAALRALLGRIPVTEYEDQVLVLRYCPKCTVRTVAELPRWVHALFVDWP